MAGGKTLIGAAATMKVVARMPDSAAAADRALALECARGEAAAFERIYQTHGEKMKSIAYNHLGNIGDAEDAVQETLLKVHRGGASFSGDSSFATWMYRILINTCYDMLRRRRRRPEERPLDAAIEHRSTSVDEAKRLTLRTLLAALPEQRRTVFMLFEIEGLSHAEIGSILGISEANSKWILFSTKKELQKRWSATQ